MKRWVELITLSAVLSAPAFAGDLLSIEQHLKLERACDARSGILIYTDAELTQPFCMTEGERPDQGGVFVRSVPDHLRTAEEKAKTQAHLRKNFRPERSFTMTPQNMPHRKVADGQHHLALFITPAGELIENGELSDADMLRFSIPDYQKRFDVIATLDITPNTPDAAVNRIKAILSEANVETETRRWVSEQEFLKE